MLIGSTRRAIQDDSAERSRTIEVPIENITSDGLQNDVDAATLSALQDRLRPAGVFVVDGDVSPEAPGEVPLVLSRGGGRDQSGAEHLGDLDGQPRHAAGPGGH